MLKYKEENQILLNKIAELEKKIIDNNNRFTIHKKEFLEIQTKLKRENHDFNTQIIDLQNKIGFS